MIRQACAFLLFLVVSTPAVSFADKACKDNTECSASELCEREKGDCLGTSMGHCTAKPSECPTETTPVCGCDSSTYANDCVRKKAGTSFKHAGECKGTDEQ